MELTRVEMALAVHDKYPGFVTPAEIHIAFLKGREAAVAEGIDPPADPAVCMLAMHAFGEFRAPDKRVDPKYAQWLRAVREALREAGDRAAVFEICLYGFVPATCTTRVAAPDLGAAIAKARIEAREENWQNWEIEDGAGVAVTDNVGHTISSVQVEQPEDTEPREIPEDKIEAADRATTGAATKPPPNEETGTGSGSPSARRVTPARPQRHADTRPGRTQPA